MRSSRRARTDAMANRRAFVQTVTSDYTPLQHRVESVVQIAMAIVTPLSALAPGHSGAKASSLVDDFPVAKKRATNGLEGVSEAAEEVVASEA